MNLPDMNQHYLFTKDLDKRFSGFEVEYGISHYCHSAPGILTTWIRLTEQVKATPICDCCNQEIKITKPENFFTSADIAETVVLATTWYETEYLGKAKEAENESPSL